MAGIGFQLRNLFKNNSFYGGTKALAVSSVVIAGPMILCIALITMAQLFLLKSDAPFYERELLLAGTLYSFVFSQLITGGFTMLFSRYLADLLFANRKENILSSLYGILAVCLLVGGIVGSVYLLFSPLVWTYKVFSYLFFMELIVVWILCIYISALKKYMQIVRGFFVGVCLSGIAIWFCFYILNVHNATIIFACMNLGFFMMILLYLSSIKQQFSVNNQRYFDFLAYFERYPSLFFIGLLYTLGLYGHSFIVWGSNLNVLVGNTFVIAPFYDVPVYYAYLTTLPAMIMFVVSMETTFHKEYKNFYSMILGSSPLYEIKLGQSKMLKALSRELLLMMEVQLFFTLMAVALGTRLLPFTVEQIDVFNIMVIGNYFFIIMFIIVQILLYFDDRKGALIVISTYCLSILFLTFVTTLFGKYGISVFLAGALGLGVAFIRLNHYCKHLGYYTYCSQPLVNKKAKLAVGDFIQRLNSLNGVGGKYESKE
jgi:polysaccharide biosynthesis protein PelG